MNARCRGWGWPILIIAVLTVGLPQEVGIGQSRRRRDEPKPERFRYATDFQNRKRKTKPQIGGQSLKPERNDQLATVAPSECYKDSANLDLEDVQLDFFNTGFKWPQPGGPGAAVTITYSFSNLLNGQMRGLPAAELKKAVEEALSVWATYAPLHFVEVVDSGPIPTSADTNYVATARPHIRFGHHTIDGLRGSSLAHAYLPYSDVEGLAGDIHFDRDEDWGAAAGGFFLEAALHETGHALGLDHEVDVDAIMNPIVDGRFAGIADAFLLADDIAGIRDIYGMGVGNVTPLDEPDDQPDDEPNDDEPDDGIGGVTASIDSESAH